MNAGELLDLFRLEARDNQAPYLWSDLEIYGYLDAAQEMFCRLTHGIPDSTSGITQLAVVADEPSVELDSRILRLRNARLESDGRHLILLNPEDVELGGQYIDDYGVRTRLGLDLTETGTPKYLIVGHDASFGRLAPIPTADDTLILTVQRLPLTALTARDSTLEIAAHHHRYLLNWALHLAHRKQDAEAYDRGRSEQFKADFLAYCDLAKRERERGEHKHRTVAYGGL